MRPSRGFTLVEMMVAVAIGLIVLAGLATVFIAQRQVYSTASSQGAIQNADNALSAILSPAIRGAGFTGCGTLATTRSEVVFTTAANPWTFSPGDFSAPVFGYDASGTGVSGGSAGSYTYTALNVANSTTSSDWNPSLDASFSGLAEKGSDILILNGEVPGTHPLGVPIVNQATAPNTFTVYNKGSTATNPIQFTDINHQNIDVQVSAVAISDCAKSSVFLPVMTTTSSGAARIGNPVTVSGTGNKSTQVNPIYQSGTQFVPLQQVAYFVGHGDGGQSALYQATLVNGAWNTPPPQLVPGVDNMQVLYGFGLAGNTQQYLSADQVQALQASPPPGVISLPFNPWSAINSIRIGFLIEGGLGSAAVGSNPTVWNVLGTQITVPADTRLRHVYVMTVNLRNVTL